MIEFLAAIQNFIVKLLNSQLLLAAITALFTSLASYFATFKLTKKEREENRSLKKTDLIESLTIELSKLLQIFEKLKEDVEKYNYFSLRNTQIAQTSIARLKILNEQIILFEDDSLRKNIIEVTDLAFSLIEEINLMENFQVNEENKLRDITKEAEKDYRLLRLNLLPQNIIIQDRKAKYIMTPTNKSKKTDDKLSTIESIFNELLSEIDQTRLNSIKTENERKRSLLVVRILDTQTKIRDLISYINE